MEVDLVELLQYLGLTGKDTFISVLFIFILFYFKNVFLSFIIALANFITSLFLFYETKSLDKKASNYLIFYVYFNLFATILMLTIYFMNL